METYSFLFFTFGTTIVTIKPTRMGCVTLTPAWLAMTPVMAGKKEPPACKEQIRSRVRLLECPWEEFGAYRHALFRVSLDIFNVNLDIERTVANIGP
jgi:hypothetical protein